MNWTYIYIDFLPGDWEDCLTSEIGILIHHVVVVCYFPVHWNFIVNGQYIDQVNGTDVGFKANYILDGLVILRTKEHGWVILVLNVKFHWWFNHCCHGHQVRFVVVFQKVKDVSIVVRSRSVIGCWSAHNWTFDDGVTVFRAVGGPFHIQTIVNFNFEYLDRGLFNS